MKKNEKTRLLKQIDNTYKKVMKETDRMQFLLIPLLMGVEDNFVNLQDSGKDKVYGFAFDESMERTHEMSCRAVMMRDGYLHVYLTDVNDQVETYSKEDMLADYELPANETHWYTIGGGMVLDCPTLMSIAESISQYI